jgi:DeoR/GlpR family transcriptional regulator of sugar metabolism
MNRSDRWNALLEILAREGSLDVEDAAVELAVSTATIRRDLDELGQQQMLVRTRGGAVPHSVSYDLPLRYKAGRQAPEKQRIARAAAALIPDHAVVGINGGTTTTEVARALAMRASSAGSDERNLTIVTNALNISSELAVRQQIKIVSTGGVPHRHSFELIGPYARHVLEQVHLDFAIVGVDGVDPESGLTGHNEDEAIVNQLMVTRARTVIVVADSTKLGQRAFARIADIHAVQILVTDSAANAELCDRFTEAGLKVIRA